MPDVQIAPLGTEPAPAGYVIPRSADLLLKMARATFDGSGAASAFVPLIRIKSDAGLITGEAEADSQVAAGASADVTWFPRVAPAGDGIKYDVNNTGDWLSVEASGAGGTLGVALALVVDGNGGLYLVDNGNGGLNLTDHGSGGVQLSADRPGILNLFGNDTRIKLETVGATEPNILLESIGGIVLQDNNLVGDGGITLEVRPGSYITMATLPVADPGVSGAVWNNAGVLNVSP